ncbi:MAG: DEAD/DEAH box helicase [Nitrospirae bacterium]|nr:DEAD/DEAH box helicase [Nitrospirota bacterium]
MKFEELDIPQKVLEGINAAGFTDCTPVQEITLPEALTGIDIAVQAQTGTGKTAAFLITVFSRMLRMQAPGRGPSPRALIIAPTRELVLQIDAEARLIGGPSGFRILPVFGGIDYLKQREQISDGVDVLIGTPGRLIDYLKQKVYSLRKTQFLVIDEADRLFNMGFIADVRFLLKRMSPYDKRQSMLYSATLSSRVLELCYEYMNMPKKFSLTPGEVTVDRIEQELYHVGSSEKFGLLLGILRREPGGRYLIFCNTRAETERLDRLLNANGCTAASITGDLDQKKRIKVLTKFKQGELPVLIATDVASRGIHIENVTHVINYDFPQDPEDYVHRIGRTARAGAYGKAISLACDQYVYSLYDVEEYIKRKIPVNALTDDMVLKDYHRRVKHPHEPASGGRQDSRHFKRGHAAERRPAGHQVRELRSKGGFKKRMPGHGKANP